MSADNTFESLDKAFKTKPTFALDKNLSEVRKEKNLPVPEQTHDQQLEDDFQEARDILKRSAAYSEEAIQGIMHIAKNSDHPRAYEVAGQLINSLQNNAKDMLDVQAKQKKITQDDKPKSKGATTNNNLFVGSTKDLLRALGKEDDTKIIEG
jgi:hypothetical protein